MDSSVEGRKEFSCSVKGPGNEGLDFLNVNVQIDTSWIFQETEDTSNERRLAAKVKSADLETLKCRIKVLEQSEQTLRESVKNYMESDPVLRNRVKELELSEKKLLEVVDQLNADLHLHENANARIKGRLQDMQAEIQDQIREKEKSERGHKEKLRRLQDHLKVKEGEIKSQSEYFEHYKEKRRQQMTALREHEHCLQNQVLNLEKEVLDLSVTKVLLMTELQQAKERGYRKYQSPELKTSPKALQNSTDFDDEEGRDKTFTDIGHHDPERHIQMLQQDFKMLLEREEASSVEKNKLMSQLQQSEEKEDFLNKKLEELRCHIYELKLSESSLQEKVEELEEEKKKLKTKLEGKPDEDACNKTLVGAEDSGKHSPVNVQQVESGKQLAVEDEESGKCKTGENEHFVSVFEEAGIEAEDIEKTNEGLFKDLQSLLQSVKALQHQAQVTERQSLQMEKERDTIKQQYEHVVREFEDLQLGFDKTCCDYVNRVLELQRSTTDYSQIGEFFDHLSEAMQEPVKSKQLSRLCSAISVFMKLHDTQTKYKDLQIFLSHLILKLQNSSLVSEDELLNLKWEAAWDPCRNKASQTTSFTEKCAKDHFTLAEKASGNGSCYRSNVTALQRDIHRLTFKCNPSAIAGFTEKMSAVANEQVIFGTQRSDGKKEFTCQLGCATNHSEIEEFPLSSLQMLNTEGKIKDAKANNSSFFPQRTSNLIPVSVLTSMNQPHLYLLKLEKNKTPSVGSEFTPLIDKSLSINQKNVSSKPKACISKNTCQQLKGVSSDKDMKALHEIIYSLEIETVKLQVKKYQLEKYLVTKEKELQQSSEDKKILQEELQEAKHQILILVQNSQTVVNDEQKMLQSKENNLLNQENDVLLVTIGQNRANEFEKQIVEFQPLKESAQSCQEKSGLEDKKQCPREVSSLRKGQDSHLTISTILHTNQECVQKIPDKGEEKLTGPSNLKDLMSCGKSYDIKGTKNSLQCEGNERNTWCQGMVGMQENEHNSVLIIGKEPGTLNQKPLELEKTGCKNAQSSQEKSGLEDKKQCPEEVSSLRKGQDSHLTISTTVHTNQECVQKIPDKGEEKLTDPSNLKDLMSYGKSYDIKGTKNSLQCERNERNTWCQGIVGMQENEHNSVLMIGKEPGTLNQKPLELEKTGCKNAEPILEPKNDTCSENSSLGEEEYRQKTTVLKQEDDNHLRQTYFQEEKWQSCSEALDVLHRKSNNSSQKMSILEKQNNIFSLKVDAREKENKGLFQEVNDLETEGEKCSQNVLASDEIKVDSAQTLLPVDETCVECYQQNAFDVAGKKIHCPSKILITEQANNVFFNKCYDLVEKAESTGKVSMLPESTKLCMEITIPEDEITDSQLVSDLNEERDRYLKQIYELLQEKDAYLKNICALKDEKDGYCQTIAELEKEKECFLRNVSDLSAERNKHITKITELQQCNKKSGTVISKLKKGNNSLKNKFHRFRVETSERLKTSDEITQNAISENCELREVISDLESSYEGLIQDTVSGLEDMMQSLKRENETLLHKIYEMEADSTLLVNQVELFRKEKEQLLETIKKLDDRNATDEKGVQFKGTEDTAQKRKECTEFNKVLQQQVLTLKSQLKDQDDLQKQLRDIQTEVAALRAQLTDKISSCTHLGSDRRHVCSLSTISCPAILLGPSDKAEPSGPSRMDQVPEFDDTCQGQIGNQLAGAPPQGRGVTDTFKKGTWFSGEQTDGSASATSAESHLSKLSVSRKKPKSTAMETMRATKTKPELPAAVHSVHIIKSVGKRSLMIGWDRPMLDELGCSNGVFIKGYRIFINGQFHKSIMSSACTKTVLENLDLSAPFQISVQTIGISGLDSEKVHVQFCNHFPNKESLSTQNAYPEEIQTSIYEVTATVYLSRHVLSGRDGATSSSNCGSG
uniref:Uncharacterized protein C4orf50 homolog n=1 Tax=Geotrypetes seraphini TaxID=260995 RepID=A0A6P8SAT5_GEOSA|nr:uncharacterized protein C4orf50 homolog [Geotrypetes seraphini]